jgi:hypothetical protein
MQRLRMKIAITTDACGGLFNCRILPHAWRVVKARPVSKAR